MSKVNLPRTYLLCTIPWLGFLLGAQLDRIEDNRMSRFRDKSALYRRAVPPAKPSW